MTKVNDYDAYASLRQKELQGGEKLPHRFVEKPAMEKILPDLSNLRVLMLGCGTGEESSLLEAHGASNMIGVDLSAVSIQLAQKTYPQYEFIVGDMHNLPFENEQFDFTYSSLTIHYSSTPLALYEEVARVLRPGGLFQFSIGHPMRWASERLEINNTTSKVLGYSENKDNPRLYGSYSKFSEYKELFPSGEVLKFWVGPPSMHYSLLKQANFNVEEFIETRAIEECKEVDSYYYERFSNFPQFTIFAARKKWA